MFGYVKTDLPNMYVKDTVLYRSLYCGLCKGIGKSCGQRCRFALNYDLTFLSAFIHNVCDKDVVIKKQRCAVHWLRRRPVAIPDELTERIAALNIILAYFKCGDDVIDNGKGRLKRSFFKAGYKKAKRKEPELDNTVKKYYDQLLKYESAACDSMDMVSDPFGNMMKEIAKILTGEYYSEEIGNLSYNIGKWIYLIDAVDDFDKDKKKKNFNVFINAYKDIATKKELVKLPEVNAVFASVLGDIITINKSIKYKFNHDLVDNILIFGLTEQTKKVMGVQKNEGKLLSIGT